MYSWIWRRLPGNFWTRVATAVVLSLGVAVLLWFVIFPWVEPRVPFTGENGQVGDNGVTSTPSSSPGQDVIPYSTVTPRTPGATPTLKG